MKQNYLCFFYLSFQAYDQNISEIEKKNYHKNVIQDDNFCVMLMTFILTHYKHMSINTRQTGHLNVILLHSNSGYHCLSKCFSIQQDQTEVLDTCGSETTTSFTVERFGDSTSQRNINSPRCSWNSLNTVKLIFPLPPKKASLLNAPFRSSVQTSISSWQ